MGTVVVPTSVQVVPSGDRYELKTLPNAGELHPIWQVLIRSRDEPAVRAHCILDPEFAAFFDRACRPRRSTQQRDVFISQWATHSLR